jgi:hypothetical protein
LVGTLDVPGATPSQQKEATENVTPPAHLSFVRKVLFVALSVHEAGRHSFTSACLLRASHELAQAPNQQQGQPFHYWKKAEVIEACDRIKHGYKFTEYGLVTARKLLSIV